MLNLTQSDLRGGRAQPLPAVSFAHRRNSNASRKKKNYRAVLRPRDICALDCRHYYLPDYPGCIVLCRSSAGVVSLDWSLSRTGLDRPCLVSLFARVEKESSQKVTPNNNPDAPDPATAGRFQIGRQWHWVRDPCHSTFSP